MQVYLQTLEINDVRGLKDITIEIGNDKCNHLILTGKNGSGKTSVLEAISSYLNALATDQNFINILNAPKIFATQIELFKKDNESNQNENSIYQNKKKLESVIPQISKIKKGIDFTTKPHIYNLYEQFNEGQFIIGYYKAEREFKATISNHVEKVVLKDSYSINETPRDLFIKFLVDLKMTELLALNKKNLEKAEAIGNWFKQFEELMQEIVDDNTLKIEFDDDTFSFYVNVKNKPNFDFNMLSSGYAAVLDIVVDIILRMQSKKKYSFVFDIPGIVLIDEVETHLHLELQKQILPLLTKIFPKIQFILTTHSPFILNSVENAVIYDLEKNLLVKNGLANVSYDGIVKGYFNASEMSNELENKFRLYKELVLKDKLTDEELAEISKLEDTLTEIPDFLSMNIATEFQQLKIEFDKREDF